MDSRAANGGLIDLESMIRDCQAMGPEKKIVTKYYNFSYSSLSTPATAV